jgi:hypothetical protein
LRRRSFCRRSGFQTGQPLERSQTRHEAVLASLNGDELRKTVKAATNRAFRNGEDPFSAAVAEDGILFSSVTDEIAVSDPLRLHKLELLPLMHAD